MNFIRSYATPIALLTSFLCSATVASAYDTNSQVYAWINKELRSVSQDADANKISKVGFTEVDGLESRLGLRGNFNDDEWDIDYAVELGLNTNKDSSSTVEQIRMRHAYVKFNNSWGDVTLGKFWLPDSLRLLKIDPLLGSGIHALGGDYSAINSTTDLEPVSGGMGFRFRAFKDQITYQTKNYNGFQYSLSLDQNGEGYSGDLADDGEVMTHTIAWDKDFGSVKNYLTLISSKLSFDKATTHAEENLQLANKTVFGNNHVSIAYGTQTTGNDGKNTRSLLGYSYVMGDNRYAISTNVLEKENAAGTKLGSFTTIGFGYFHTVSKLITLRATAGQMTVKSEAADTFSGGYATSKSENKATIIALGGIVKF